MLAFLVDKNPFMAEESLRSIASGVVAGERVNVDKAHEVGMKIVRDMAGKNVEDFKFSMKIITMNDSASIQVGGDELLIVAVLGALPHDLQNFFAYELCTYPSPLFESAPLLRQANKSVLAKDIANPILNDDSIYHSFETKYVIVRGRNYKELCEMYVKYIMVSQYISIAKAGKRNQQTLKLLKSALELITG
ncbi:hypothetical protein MAR_008083 [Mya arenaria]|uniref:Uncharacterized protein n=1 Tax=Mya arenaria TaxID=6604 RepID=A0ABY7DXY9_MYAAR|nr:hypothetical protein MAR_008083 [Mya arenaria]